jgi:hypothetical protein
VPSWRYTRASRRSGSMTQTRRVPAESQSAILASSSPGRSPGERTSSTRSGAQVGEPDRFRRGEALAADKGHVGGAHGVGVPCQGESRFRRVDGAQLVGADVTPELDRDVQRDTAVASAGGFADHQHSSDQLDALVGNPNVEQLVRGQQARHGRNVGGLGWHRKTIWPRCVNGPSTERGTMVGRHGTCVGVRHVGSEDRHSSTSTGRGVKLGETAFSASRHLSLDAIKHGVAETVALGILANVLDTVY